MESKFSQPDTLPPAYEQYSNNSQPPPMIIQQGGAQMMYPNQPTQIMIQPGVPQVIYDVPYNESQPIGTPVTFQTQPIRTHLTNESQPLGTNVMYQPHGTDPQTYRPKYATLHYRTGIAFICIGILTCIIDPLIPVIIHYGYSILPAGLFMIISGATSLAGRNKASRCLLIVAMIFDILASLNLFGAFLPAIVVISVRHFLHLKGFGIFMLLYCSLLLSVVIWDSSTKCRDVCCGGRRHRQQPTNQVYIYMVQAQPSAVQ